MMKPEFVNEWVTVSQQLINKPESKNVRGVKIQFMLPPSDVPSATRAWIDESGGPRGVINIEFKYLASPEPQKTLAENDGLRFVVGKNSGRIYQMILDVVSVCGPEVQGDIQIGFGIRADQAKQVEEYARSHDEINQGNAGAINRLFTPQEGKGELPINSLLTG
jgi:hypothetical protein